MKTTMLMLLATATLLSLGALYADESVQYPDTFRRWMHVGTGVILPAANSSTSCAMPSTRTE